MRILQINNIHYKRGGADVVYLNTGKLLDKKGHKIFYFSQKNEKNDDLYSEEYFIDEVNYFDKSLIDKVFTIPRFFYSYEAKKKLSKLIKEIQPHLAHVHLYKGFLTPSILIALKENKVPIVITLHDYGLLCPHNLMLDGNMNICSRCVNGSALNCIINKCNRNDLLLSTISSIEYIFHRDIIPFEKYFNKIIAVSKFGKKIHLESGKFKGKIAHLYNFYPNLSLTVPNIEKGNYFIYFGRLSKEKGILTLCNAWIREERKLKLKIVGTGELFDELQEKFNNKSNIEILGYKSGLELINLIQESAFVIVPSEWYENNPLTIIEAYANGKPVIGSDTGGIPEIINHGATGFIFEMGSVKGLSDMLIQAESITEIEYQSLSINARKFAEDNFSEDMHYNSLIDIYNSVL